MNGTRRKRALNTMQWSNSGQRIIIDYVIRSTRWLSKTILNSWGFCVECIEILYNDSRMFRGTIFNWFLVCECFCEQNRIFSCILVLTLSSFCLVLFLQKKYFIQNSPCPIYSLQYSTVAHSVIASKHENYLAFSFAFGGIRKNFGFYCQKSENWDYLWIFRDTDCLRR